MAKTLSFCHYQNVKDTWKMSWFEKLLPFLISLLLLDVDVELLLNPKMSPSSSSSKKDETLGAFFAAACGLTVWKRSSVLSSKIEGSVLISLSFFSPTPLLAWGWLVLVVSLVEGLEGLLVTELAPKRLWEPKRSSSSDDSGAIALLLYLPEPVFSAFVVTGRVSSEGLGENWGDEGCPDERVGNDGGAAEIDGGTTCVWLGFSGGGKTKADTLEPCPRASATPPFLSSRDFWAACCLAALDWGLRSTEPFTRVCVTQKIYADILCSHHNSNKSNEKT